MGGHCMGIENINKNLLKTGILNLNNNSLIYFSISSVLAKEEQFSVCCSLLRYLTYPQLNINKLMSAIQLGCKLDVLWAQKRLHRCSNPRAESYQPDILTTQLQRV